MEKEENSNGRSKSLSIDFLWKWMLVIGIISFFSMWVHFMLPSFLSFIKDFLKIFVSSYSYISIFIQIFGNILVAIFLFLTIVFYLPKIVSKKYEEKTYVLSLYITLLLFSPLIFGYIFEHIEVNTIFLISGSLFIILLSLKLCLKHHVLDILLLFWFGIILILLLILLIQDPTTVQNSIKASGILQWPTLIMFLLLIILIILYPILYLRKVQKEISTEKFFKEFKELTTKFINFLKTLINFLKVLITLKGYSFDDYEFRLINKIFFLIILTITLFTIGTIFIHDFTHVEDYKQLNITNAPSLNCSNSTTCNNNISDICNIYSKNSINATNETLTVKINKDNKDNREFTLTISSLCEQYDQDRKDFVTYFSALIGVVIAFFISIYDRFIRKKEKTKNDKEQE